MITVRLLIIFTLLIVCTNTKAEYLLVDDTTESYDLTDYVDYIIDETNTMDIINVQSMPDENWLKSKYTQYGFSAGTIWLRIKIDFSKTKQDWFINEKISTFDSFTFYNPDGNQGAYQASQYGLFSEKPYLFDSRSILLQPLNTQDRRTYYVAVKTGTPMLFVLSLLNKSALNTQTFRESIELGIFYGAAIVCFMFHLFLYFSLSEKKGSIIYIFYCSYVLSFTWLSLYFQGLRKMVFGPPFTINDLGFSFSNPATTFSVALGAATFSFYAFAYVQLEIKRFPRLKTCYLLCMAILASIFIPLIFVRSSLFMGLFGGVKITISCALLVVALYLYRKKNILPAIYFLFALSFTVTGVIIYYLTILGLIKGNQFTSYSATYSAVLEYILLAFSLSAQINETTKSHQRELNQTIFELTEAENAANKANRLKDEFLATSSHELKTPLTAIYGYMQVMKDTPIDTLQEVCVDGSIDQIEQLTKLVNDLLDYARIESGHLSYDISSCNPVDVIISTVDGTSPHLMKKSVQFTTKIIDKDKVSMTKVDIDSSRLKQLTANLITNALKFTDKGFVNINIYCTKDSTRNQVKYVLEVKDTGIGISKDQLDEIFVKFHQVSQGRSRNNEGIGLGLAIVRSIAELFNGTIDVQSTLGIGSTFVFTFSAPISQKATAIESTPNDADSGEILPKNARILLVEDNLHNQTIFQYFIDTLSLQLDTASSVDESISLVNSTCYTAIFVDLHMPGKDGYQLVNYIRNELGNKEIVLVAVSADSRPATKRKCKETGFDDFIEKPIKKYLLHAKIKEITSPSYRQNKAALIQIQNIKPALRIVKSDIDS